MYLLRRVICSCVLLLLAASPALAQEVINTFISDVTVNVDASLTVRETIVVRAEGTEIRRGINRDFPTTYTNKNGVRVKVGFDVLSVKRDGQDENFVVENVSNGKRIKIGNKDVFLEYGEHTYVITYQTTRQIGFFDQFDELYWNVTGNGWTFPIRNAKTIVRLPAGAQVLQHAIYTGRQGESGDDARVTQASGARFEAETTRGLMPNEGFTIAVAWPKGIVTAPTLAQQRNDWIKDNLGFFGLSLTLLLVPLYYVWAWLRVGRDPPQGTIVPLFKPPVGMAPAGVRYVYNAGYDDKAFAAGLVGLAVKGLVSISNDGSDYTIRRKGDQADALTRSERALFNVVPRVNLTLEQSNNSTVRDMRSQLESSLDDEYDGVMYLKNLKWFLWGFALSVLGLALSAILMPTEIGALVLAVGGFSTVWWGVILAVGYGLVKGLVVARGAFAKMRAIIGMLFLVPFILGGLGVGAAVVAVDGLTGAAMWFLVGAIALLAINFLFFWLLKAPTQKGRAVLDELEGFRMYLRTAEEERLKILHPPEKTPELFERYLPYAMALDCENEWNAKFATILAAAAATGAAAGSVGSWYDGPGGFRSSDFSKDLGHSLTSAISSSSVAPGSSSGSGGGGSSGGGGGGGGGSGW